MKGVMGFLKGLLLPLLAAAALVCFATAVDSLNDGQSSERLRQVEQAVRRSCAACYAAEGAYPPDLDYLKDRYGLQINDGDYIVHYAAQAGNLMPDIVVMPAQPQAG